MNKNIYIVRQINSKAPNDISFKKYPNIKIYNEHHPNMKITMRDGTEYLTNQNGSWIKTKEKNENN